MQGLGRRVPSENAKSDRGASQTTHFCVALSPRRESQSIEGEMVLPRIEGTGTSIRQGLRNLFIAIFLHRVLSSRCHTKLSSAFSSLSFTCPARGNWRDQARPCGHWRDRVDWPRIFPSTASARRFVSLSFTAIRTACSSVTDPIFRHAAEIEPMRPVVAHGRGRENNVGMATGVLLPLMQCLGDGGED